MITAERKQFVRDIALAAYLAPSATTIDGHGLNMAEFAFIRGWLRGAYFGYEDGVSDAHANDPSLRSGAPQQIQFEIIIGAQQVAMKSRLYKLGIDILDCGTYSADYREGFCEAHSSMFESGMKERIRRDAEPITPPCVTLTARAEQARRDRTTAIIAIAIALGVIAMGMAFYQVVRAAQDDRAYRDGIIATPFSRMEGTR